MCRLALVDASGVSSVSAAPAVSAALAVSALAPCCGTGGDEAGLGGGAVLEDVALSISGAAGGLDPPNS